MTTRAKILVVEDDANLRELLRGILEDAGHLVRLCSSAKRAMEWCLDGPPYPDLLVVDLHLPEFSGLEMLRALHRCGIRIPTLVVSGLFDSLTASQMNQIGCQAYLEKPFEVGRFLGHVRDLAAPREAMTDSDKSAPIGAARRWSSPAPVRTSEPPASKEPRWESAS